MLVELRAMDSRSKAAGEKRAAKEKGAAAFAGRP